MPLFIFFLLHLGELRTHIASSKHILGTVSSHLGFISTNLIDSLSPILLTHIPSPTLLFFLPPSLPLRNQGLALTRPLVLMTALWPPLGNQAHLFSLWLFLGCQVMLEMSACVICLQRRSQVQPNPTSKLCLRSRSKLSLMPGGPLLHFLILTTDLESNPHGSGLAAVYLQRRLGPPAPKLLCFLPCTT